MNHVLKEIRFRIIEISDPELQRKLWLNENNDTGLESSYDELICTLFDDFDFKKFVKYYAKEYGLDDSVISELKLLMEMLNGYSEKRTYLEIIEDQEWKKISQQAVKILELWKDNNQDTLF